jgi:FkbM family methyltransferase
LLTTRIVSKVLRHPNNRKNPVGALMRAVAWQLYKRTNKRPLSVRFSDGFSALCFTDSNSASNVFYFNKYFDPDEMSLMRRVLRPGDGFIDGGANVGFYSLLAASLVGPTGRVVAFEPFQGHVDKFRTNVKFNGFNQISLRQVALSDKKGTVSFVTNRDVSNRIQSPIDQDAPTVTVQASTLDDELAGLPPFTVGKLDLEGAEVAALAGASGMLASATPPLWIIEWNPIILKRMRLTAEDLLGPLERHGYGIVNVQGDRLISAKPPAKGNIIVAHRESIEMLESRLRERPFLQPSRWSLPRPVTL